MPTGGTLARNAFLRHHGFHLFVLPYWRWVLCPHECRETLIFKHVCSMVSGDFFRYHRDTKARIRGRERRAYEAQFGKKKKHKRRKKAEGLPMPLRVSA